MIFCRLLLLVGLLTPSLAWATISCTVSVTTMNFGSQNGAATVPGPTPVTVNCTSSATYYVGVNGGNNSGGSNYTWNAAGPSGSTIPYKLYQDSGRTTLLGNTPAYDTISGTGTGSAQTVYLYPKVSANSAVVPGSYSDSVTITVTVVGGSPVTTTMAVMATVPASCTVSVLPLNFGTYSGAQTDTTSTITATCTNTTAYSANVDQGLHYSSFYNPRMIGPGGALLAYHLYRDSARTQLWGNTAYSDGVTGTGSGAAQYLTIYARLSGSQFVAPGTYSDTIIVTLNY